jgi:hypothetical protein
MSKEFNLLGKAEAQPAPAEQGRAAGQFAAYMHYLCVTGAENKLIIRAVWDHDAALLASRPQPEAKVVLMAMLREIMQGASDFGPSDESARVIVAKYMPGYTVKE